MTKQATATKVVNPIARYFLKASGIVIYTVQPSERSQAEGETEPYRVCIHKGKATCTCKGFTKWHKCCHSSQLLERENNRSITPALAATEIQWVTMPDGHTRLASQANDPCLNSLAQMAEDYGKLQEEWKRKQAEYDVIGEALQVVNAEIVSQRVGDAYEQRAEQMRRDAEKREEYVRMFDIY